MFRFSGVLTFWMVKGARAKIGLGQKSQDIMRAESRLGQKSTGPKVDGPKVVIVVQSIIRREEEDRAVPLVMEEVPEAIMTPGIREGLASLDTVDMCHLFSTGQCSSVVRNCASPRPSGNL